MALKLGFAAKNYCQTQVWTPVKLKFGLLAKLKFGFLPNSSLEFKGLSQNNLVIFVEQILIKLIKFVQVIL
jgi:hypothetical protein